AARGAWNAGSSLYSHPSATMGAAWDSISSRSASDWVADGELMLLGPEAEEGDVAVVGEEAGTDALAAGGAGAKAWDPMLSRPKWRKATREAAEAAAPKAPSGRIVCVWCRQEIEGTAALDHWPT